jgi:FkbM family methyltransferase
VGLVVSEGAWSGSRWARSPLFDPPAVRGVGADAYVDAVARVTDDPETFAARERAGHQIEAEYRLRESGRPVVVRHGTPDIGVLDEVFVRRFYEPPAPVRRVLASLARPVRVVDLGANIGLAGAYFLGLLGNAEIVSFEPDRLNLRLLERCVALNADAASWRVVPACAGCADGEAWFLEGAFSSSQVALHAGDRAVRLPVVDVLPALAGADLVKADMEGGEWAVFEDPRFARAGVRVLVAEYHAHLCPGDEPRERLEAHLDAAGYRTHHLFQRPQQQVGMLWAWRD